MIIRKAKTADIDAVAKIYDEIHSEIEKGNLTVGWEKGVYPVKSTAQNAMEKGWLFVAEDNGTVVSAAIINQYQGPIYEEADWEYTADENEVMVLHSLYFLLCLIKNFFLKIFFSSPDYQTFLE